MPNKNFVIPHIQKASENELLISDPVAKKFNKSTWESIFLCKYFCKIVVTIIKNILAKKLPTFFNINVLSSICWLKKTVTEYLKNGKLDPSNSPHKSHFKKNDRSLFFKENNRHFWTFSRPWKNTGLLQ